VVRLFLFIAILFLVGCDTTSSFNPPDKSYFTKFFGGDGDQFAVDMVVDVDGSVYILGNSKIKSSSDQQGYLAKADAQGNLIWEKYFSAKLDAKDLEFTSDGYLIMVGNKPTSNTDMDILVRRFTKQGVEIDSALISSKVIGSNDNNINAFKNDYVNSITELKNGNFVLIGYTDNAKSGHALDVLNIQIDNTLKKMSYSYNESNGSGTINKGAKLLQNKNSFYVFGSSNISSKSDTDSDVWACSLTVDGYGGTNTDLQTEFVKPTYDEFVTNVVKSFTGYGLASVSSQNNNLTLRVIKISGDSLRFDSNDIGAIKEISLGTGTEKFSMINNGYGNSGYFVVSTYYALGAATSDIALYKLDDQSLAQIWGPNPILFGGAGDDSAAAVEELPDGKILILGTMQLGNPTSQFKIALIKVNSNGKL
jgi:hypothetical protein